MEVAMSGYRGSRIQRISSVLVVALLLTLAVVPHAAAESIRASASQSSSSISGNNLVTNIVLTPWPSNVLAAAQAVNATFDYRSGEPGGVRIFVRPYSGAAATPNYAAHGSPLYPVGTGSGTGYFRIESGTALVDRIRITMYNADQSRLLFESFLPVHYLYSDAGNLVTNVRLSPQTPNIVGLNENINLTFDYQTTVLAGVRIFARPFSGSNTTPGYGAHGSPLYPVGTGSGTGWFNIDGGSGVIDRIRLQMYNADQTVLLFEYFLPVHYLYSGAANLVTNVSLGPPTPNIVALNENVNLTFDYRTNVPGGVRIFARPYSGDDLTPGYAAHGSPLYPVGTGNGSGSFNIGSGSGVIDKIRLRMYNADQSELLFEAFMPVHYQYHAPYRLFLPALLRNR
jgi:hypothetical protein